jgi:PBP1b-binding outer membrane lipoprotein LpoB
MRIFLAMLLFGALGFSGCETKNENSNVNRNTSTANTNLNIMPEVPDVPKPGDPISGYQSCNPYFPLVPGSQTKFSLQYSSPLIADVTVVVSQIEENGRKVLVEKTHIVDKSGGLNKAELTERKYICDNGRVQIISEKVDNRTEKSHVFVETNFRSAATVMLDTPSLMRKGTTWSYNFDQSFRMGNEPPTKNDPVTINFEAQGEEEVKVPAGTFKAIKVLRKIRDNLVNEYYVAGLGLVKRANKDGTTWELKEYSGISPITK